MTETKNILGRKISLIRKEKGLTLEEFGKIFNASKGVVSNWESGRNVPSNERLKKISELGNTTVEELLYEDSDNKLNVALKTYDTLLKQFSTDTFEGKSLRYFDEKQRNEILLYAMNVFLSIPSIDKNDKPVEDYTNSNGLQLQIKEKFELQYLKEVKTNQGLLRLLENISFKIEYLAEYSSYEFYSLNGLLVDKYETSVNEKLISEIMELQESLYNKVQQLKKEYPDEEPGLGIKVFEEPKEESFYDSKDDIMEPILILHDDESLKKISNNKEMKEFVMNRIENILDQQESK